MKSGSVWPAIKGHAIGNGVVAAQGLALPTVEPEVLVYGRVLLCSLRLGAIGMGLLWRAPGALAPSRGPSR